MNNLKSQISNLKSQILTLALFFILYSGLAQCITNSNNLPFPCAWDPTTCTTCCTSTAGGSCDFYFYCGDANSGTECNIYMMCSGLTPNSNLPLIINSWDSTYDWESLSFPIGPSGRAFGVFTKDLSGNTNNGFAANVFFSIYPGTLLQENAWYNFNCQ
jgi:hypothetical protein